VKVRTVAVALVLVALSCAPHRADKSQEPPSPEGPVAAPPPVQPDPAAALAQLKLKNQCLEVGKKARDEWVAKYREAFLFSDYPEYAYSESLNTCLYADSYSTPNDSRLNGPGYNREVRFILDVFTNKTLIEYTAIDGKAVKGSPSQATFEATKRCLMGGPPSSQGHVP
jgi:hypothetical protein